MNKEERIELLNQLQSKFNEKNDIEERVEFIESAKENIALLGDEVARLNDKLSDDKNYYRSIFFDEMREDSLRTIVENLEKEESDTLSLIEDYKKLIPQLQETIDSQSKYLKNIDKEIKAQDEDLRDSESMSEEEFKALQKKNNSSRNIKKTYENNIEDAKSKIEETNKKLEELNDKVTELATNKTKADEDLNKFMSDLENDKGVDLVEKAKDEEKLAKVKNTINFLDKSVEQALYNPAHEVENIIRDYKEDKISADEVSNRVKAVEFNLYSGYLDEDIAIRDEKSTEIKAIVKKTQKQITALEKKLADDNNYLPSIFVVEKNNRDVNKKIKEKVASMESRMGFNQKTVEEYEKYVSDNTRYFEDLKAEKANLQKDIRKAGNSIDADFEKESLARIAEIDSEMLEMTPVINEDKKRLEDAKKEKKNLESKYNRYQKVLEKRTATLKDRNKIDASAKRLDMLELARLQAGLTALGNLEDSNDKTIYETIREIANSKDIAMDVNKNVVADVAPVVDTVVPDTKQDADVVVTDTDAKVDDKVNNNTAQVIVPSIINPTVVIGDDKDMTNSGSVAVAANIANTVIPPIDVNDEKNKAMMAAFLGKLEPEKSDDKTDDIVVEPIEEKEDNSLIPPVINNDDPLGLGIFDGKKKATFTKIPELTQKAKNSDFIKNLKKWAVRASVAVAALIAAGALITRCSNEEEKVPVVENPVTTESTIEEDTNENNHADVNYDYDLDERENAIEEGKERQANDQGRPEEAVVTPTVTPTQPNTMIGEAISTVMPTLEPTLPEGYPLPSEISVDIPVTTVEDPVVYDFDTTDPNAYGEFIETDVVPGEISGGDSTFTPDEFIPTEDVTTPDTNPSDIVTEPVTDVVVDPATDIVVDPGTVDPGAPVENPETVAITVENGESLVLPGENGTDYALNNGNVMETEGANMIENPALQSMSEDENGNMQVEVTAESIARPEALTDDQIATMQAEFEAQNNPIVTEYETTATVDSSYEEPVEEQGFSR